MNDYELTTRAQVDIAQTWVHIARDKESAANAWQAAVYDNCALIAATPGIGHTRQDLTRRSVLVWTLPEYRDYQIVYDVRLEHVRILRVVHGGRRRFWKRGRLA